MKRKVSPTMVLSPEIYTQICTEYPLMLKVMQVAQQREATVFRWCSEKNDNLLKYPVLRMLADHYKKKSIDELIRKNE